MSIKYHDYNLTLQYDENYTQYSHQETMHIMTALECSHDMKQAIELLQHEYNHYDIIMPYGYVYRIIQSDGRTYIGKRKIEPGRKWGWYLGSGSGLDYSLIICKQLICFAYDENELSELEEYHIQNEINHASNRSDVINKRIHVVDSSVYMNRSQSDYAFIKGIGNELLLELYLGCSSVKNMHQYLIHAGVPMNGVVNASDDCVSIRTLRGMMDKNNVITMNESLKIANNSNENNNAPFMLTCKCCHKRFKSNNDVFYCSVECAKKNHESITHVSRQIIEKLLCDYSMKEISIILGYDVSIIGNIVKHYDLQSMIGLHRKEYVRKYSSRNKNNDVHICKQCGSEFKTSSNARQYCSHECALKSRSKLSKVCISEVEELMSNGMTITALAKHYEVSYPTMIKFMRVNNLVSNDADAVRKNDNTKMIAHGLLTMHLRWHVRRNQPDYEHCEYCMNHDGFNDNMMTPLKDKQHACLNPYCDTMITGHNRTCSDSCHHIVNIVNGMFEAHVKHHVSKNDYRKYCYYCVHNIYSKDVFNASDYGVIVRGVNDMNVIIRDKVNELRNDKNMSYSKIYGVLNMTKQSVKNAIKNIWSE